MERDDRNFEAALDELFKRSFVVLAQFFRLRPPRTWRRIYRREQDGIVRARSQL